MHWIHVLNHWKKWALWVWYRLAGISNFFQWLHKYLLTYLLMYVLLKNVKRFKIRAKLMILNLHKYLSTYLRMYLLTYLKLCYFWPKLKTFDIFEILMKKCIEYTCWIIEKREFCERDIDQRESQGENAQACNFVNFAPISKILTFLKFLWKAALNSHVESLKKTSLVNALMRTKILTRGFLGPFRRYFLNLNQLRRWNMEIDQNFKLILNFIIFFHIILILGLKFW